MRGNSGRLRGLLAVCGLVVLGACQDPPEVTTSGTRIKPGAGTTPKPAQAPKAVEDKVNTPISGSAPVSGSLLTAAKAGDVESVKRLLAAGAAVDAEDEYGGTALFLAAGGGHDKVLEVLLAAGANPNHKAKKGWTALLVASQQGKTGAVKLLLRAGAEVNAVNVNKMTPLHAAGKYPEVMKLLLAAGANRKAVDIYGYTPLYTAAGSGNEASVDLLLKLGENPVFRAPNDYSLLHWAVRWGWTKKVKLLIRLGDDVNLRGRDGITPLQLAVLGENKVLEELLKKHGATMEGKKP